jgi:hypothetical protein
MRERHAGMVVMARTYTSFMSLVAFHKKDGGRQWERCLESVSIPQGIMISDFTMPERVLLTERTVMPLACDGLVMAVRGDGDECILSQKPPILSEPPY